MNCIIGKFRNKNFIILGSVWVGLWYSHYWPCAPALRICTHRSKRNSLARFQLYWRCTSWMMQAEFFGLFPLRCFNRLLIVWRKWWNSSSYFSSKCSMAATRYWVELRQTGISWGLTHLSPAMLSFPYTPQSKFDKIRDFLHRSCKAECN